MIADVPWGVSRARAMLGTLVIIRCTSSAAIDDAFAIIARIEQSMSAHRADSDLARIARATPGAALDVDPNTVAVLRLARYWYRASLGAFDPVRAARRLAARGQRPAFDGVPVDPDATFADLHFLSDHSLRLARPLLLDLGGIAKGYAVDRAIDALNRRGALDALVNAGGDMRASGARLWPVALRDPTRPTRLGAAKCLRGLRNAALATSTAALVNPEFVTTTRRAGRGTWTSCTVRARDCVTADVLTKWGLQSAGLQSAGLQSRVLAPRMQRLLRAHRAMLWRQ